MPSAALSPLPTSWVSPALAGIKVPPKPQAKAIADFLKEKNPAAYQVCSAPRPRYRAACDTSAPAIQAGGYKRGAHLPCALCLYHK